MNKVAFVEQPCLPWLGQWILQKVITPQGQKMATSFVSRRTITLKRWSFPIIPRPSWKPWTPRKVEEKLEKFCLNVYHCFHSESASSANESEVYIICAHHRIGRNLLSIQGESVYAHTKDNYSLKEYVIQVLLPITGKKMRVQRKNIKKSTQHLYKT